MKRLGWVLYAAIGFPVLVIGGLFVVGLGLGYLDTVIPTWPVMHDDTMKTIGITFFAVAIAFIAGQWFWQARK